MPKFDSLYSKNALSMKKSVIRELLKLTTQPDIISFAGGLPALEVTLRTPVALDCIRAMAEVPGGAVGAGDAHAGAGARGRLPCRQYNASRMPPGR